ncbi:phosphatase 2C-like domain-containing protein [Mycotypha africana]|uniref:phosphatase 2C-like domain-containing protein n=1 Tax=Mycotypha africana TaxID=64632 RepID=UPI002300B1AB|nr:phosphatase 2C-like domain-containing protein [Mycotypha africana]KAI8982203.1 phosphatase 2C-like domain-containing protein [Mycotypha africana]
MLIRQPYLNTYRRTVSCHNLAILNLLKRRFSVTRHCAYKDYYLTKGVQDSQLRINLKKPSQLLGVCSSRGTRPTNEDHYCAASLELTDSERLLKMDKYAERAYFGIFDGHGGPVVSEWLVKHLHEYIENVTLDDYHKSLEFLQTYRGYFRRFPVPSVLKDDVSSNIETKQKGKDAKLKTNLSLEQRLTLAFLKADVDVLQQLRSSLQDAHQDHEGSTGSVAILEPRDKKPFWDSDVYDIIIGHVGDTRILLCDSRKGEVMQLTTGDHHPGNPAEVERLRKYAGFVTTDSWGDERIMGMLATSRAFGDAKLKRYGVSAEPDIVRYKVSTKRNPAAFMVLVTDGITSVLSDQEIVDLVKQYKDPNTAAKQLVDTCDQLQSDDNATAMVIRLKDWGKKMQDFTKDLRTYKLENTSMSRRQSW